MESLAEEWRRAQTGQLAPFTIVLRAELPSDGFETDVAVDKITLWRYSAILNDIIASCAKGQPLVMLKGVSAAVLQTVVMAWYDPLAPTWPADMLPDIFTFVHMFGMERLTCMIEAAIASASSEQIEHLRDLYLRALSCQSVRREALIALCRGHTAGSVIRALGVGLLVEDAHMVVERARSKFGTTLAMLKRFAKQNADTTSLVWEPIAFSLIEEVKGCLPHMILSYQRKWQSLDFMISTSDGETMLARHSLDLAIMPVFRVAVMGLQNELFTLKSARALPSLSN